MTFTPNKNIKYYLDFIYNRQVAFWNRYYGRSFSMWTTDPVLREYKFTNVYRLLDRSTQYLISDVINKPGKFTNRDILWRILLYKHFNIPSTWQYLTRTLGEISLKTPITDIIEAVDLYHKRGYPIYSNAYMLTASFMKNEVSKKNYGIENVTRKHEAYILIYYRYFIEQGRIDQILKAKTLEEAFIIMREIPTTGDFLAYQFVQDFNYSNVVNWDMNSFCAAGYGTQRGIERIFDFETKERPYGDVVLWVHQNFKDLLEEYNINPDPIPLGNFWPQVPDLSNCFCETDKYMRGIGLKQKGVAGKRIKNRFTPRRDKLNYVFPDKFNIILHK